MRRQKNKTISQYFVFTEYELFTLVICVILDILEYIFALLLLPGIGDFFDVLGIIACFAMFQLFGVTSLFELVPGADLIPTFILTWLIWYLIKTRRISA